jgi:hypothetical protein
MFLAFQLVTFRLISKYRCLSHCDRTWEPGQSVFFYRSTGGFEMTLRPTYRFNLDRRTGRDRRNRSKFDVIKPLISGKRENARRRNDRNVIVYFDRYSPASLWFIVIILILSVVDALLTMILIRNGAVELNPVMAYYLNISPQVFLAVKYTLTSLSVFILLVYGSVVLGGAQFHIRSVYPLIITAFASVVVWEIYLIVKVVF